MYIISNNYNRILQINGNQAWKLLNKTIVKNKIVDIVNCHQNPSVGPAMFEAETVFFRECHGDHLYFWLNNTKFPNIRDIYVDCDEPDVYDRFTSDINIYVVEEAVAGKRIKDNRPVDHRHVKVITKAYMQYMLKLANHE